MEKFEPKLNHEQARPKNYEQMLSELKNAPKITKIMYPTLVECAKGNMSNINKAEDLGSWSPDDFRALLVDLGYSMEKSEK